MNRLAAVLVACAGLVVAGCGGGGGGSSKGAPAGGAAGSTTPTTTPPPSGATPKAPAGGDVKVGSSDQYGKILTDGKGLTLYLFAKESGTKSECYGQCATAWPPFLTKGEPQAGPGVEAGGLGTTRRNDGATQVTYKGHPLYYYHGEKQAGQILCQDVDEFGGTWLIVAPDGTPIR
jgi:predicted lipoprotein with Yx(FWY)xxD motif